MSEKTLTGRALFEVTEEAWTMAPIKTLAQRHVRRQWDDLSWNEKDSYEAQADELNEARKGTDGTYER